MTIATIDRKLLRELLRIPVKDDSYPTHNVWIGGNELRVTDGCIAVHVACAQQLMPKEAPAEPVIIPSAALKSLIRGAGPSPVDIPEDVDRAQDFPPTGSVMEPSPVAGVERIDLGARYLGTLSRIHAAACTATERADRMYLAGYRFRFGAHSEAAVLFRSELSQAVIYGALMPLRCADDP